MVEIHTVRVIRRFARVDRLIDAIYHTPPPRAVFSRSAAAHSIRPVASIAQVISAFGVKPTITVGGTAPCTVHLTAPWSAIFQEDAPNEEGGEKQTGNWYGSFRNRLPVADFGPRVPKAKLRRDQTECGSSRIVFRDSKDCFPRTQIDHSAEATGECIAALLTASQEECDEKRRYNKLNQYLLVVSIRRAKETSRVLNRISPWPIRRHSPIRPCRSPHRRLNTRATVALSCRCRIQNRERNVHECPIDEDTPPHDSPGL